MKTEPVSFIYDQPNVNKKHNVLSKQNSNLSRQMLLKQDSSVSRNSLLNQDSIQSSRQILANNHNKSEQMGEYLSRQNSSNSCRALLKQDSNGSILSKQNSQVQPRYRSNDLIINSVTKQFLAFPNTSQKIFLAAPIQNFK